MKKNKQKIEKPINYTEVNWKDKAIDEVYEFYDHLPKNQKYEFFNWLSDHYSEIEFEWLEVFKDLRDEMTFDENIAACEKFLAWYPSRYPDEYDERYEFIERDLCDYYLKNWDLDNLRQRIKFISQHPVSGIDTITIRLYYQLLYHGLYEDALHYARAVLKPIEDAPDIWGNPELYFYKGLYLDSLQKGYQTFKRNNAADFTEVIRLAAELDLEEDKTIFAIEVQALTSPISPEKILSRINSQNEDDLVGLNVYFMKYMLDTYDIPFMVSDIFWNIVAVKNLFGLSTFKNDFFFIDRKTFEKITDNRFDYFFGSNSLEMFGKIWSLHYIYEFLEENQLISPEAAELMRGNNLYHRNNVIKHLNNELWQMSFVFSWPKNHFWSDLKPLFESTYGKSFAEARKMLKTFSENNKSDFHLYNDMETNESYPFNGHSDMMPYKKPTPDIGRNEPCPCGSGKKYKVCCLKK